MRCRSRRLSKALSAGRRGTLPPIHKHSGRRHGRSRVREVEFDDGINEVEATDANGIRVEVDLDPATGEPIRGWEAGRLSAYATAANQREPPRLRAAESHLYLAYSPDCIIFTCKRTLRERWRQAITEGFTGQVFLATFDDQLSVQQIDAMKEKNVLLVVPAGLKNTGYKDRMNVVSFETFFDHYLDPAIVRWKANGTIS